MRKILFLLIFFLIPLASAECKDTDGGFDYYVVGNASFGSTNLTDQCVLNNDIVESCSGEGCVLQEAICTGEQGEYKDYPCTAGCFNRICKEDMVILASGDIGKKEDDKIVFDALKYINRNGYDMSQDAIVLFSSVYDAKFTMKPILAVQNKKAVLVIKKNIPQSYEKIGKVIEDFLKEEEIDYVVKDFVSTSDLNNLFDFCRRDSDCEDNDPETEDKCGGDPPVCTNTEIKKCVSGDDFCPRGCSYPEDEECHQCSSNKDCDDGEIKTKDACSGTPKRCSNEEITECLEGDDYCPEGCLPDVDQDCFECSEHSECDDGLACTQDACENSLCLNVKASGCEYRGACINSGEIVAGKYCNGKELINQRSINRGCKEDHECTTGVCKKEKCAKIGFVSRLMRWFGSIF